MKVLERGGGNAYDAALAASACLVVVQPNLNGLGGDMFLVTDETKPVALNSSGFSAEAATPEFFRSKGYSEIPKRGPHASFMVPGIPAAWKFLAERASMKPRELMGGDAIEIARNGFRVSEKIAAAIRLMSGMTEDPDWQATYTARETGGDLLVQRDLSKTLEVLSEDLDAFYTGEIAKKIEEDMVRKGGLLRRGGDLEEYRPGVYEAPHVRYRGGYDVFTNPPNSQGLTELVWLRLLEGRENDDSTFRSAIETMETAYFYRARYIGDPRYVRFPEWLLSGPVESVAQRAGKMTFGGASDTTAFSVFDGDFGISAIQSNYMGFGSGHTIHGTGINMSNRGSYFTLDERHHNCVAPRKLSFHTLMATLARGDRKIFLGSMGGDVQPQVNVQILIRLIDLGLDIQESIDRPRFAYPATIYGTSDIYVEPGLRIEGAKGVEPLNSLMGHAQGITVSHETRAGFDLRGGDAFTQVF